MSYILIYTELNILIKVYTNTTLHIIEYVLYILVYYSIYYIQSSYTFLSMLLYMVV